MYTIRLAFKNVLGAGLRTWLNVAVLSFSFVVIVFYNGMLDGWNQQARRDTRVWETGGGQYWHPRYDPYDPFSLQDAHAVVAGKALQLVSEKQVTPVLVTQATLYPDGKMLNIRMKGIDPFQKILALPAHLLHNDQAQIPVLVGKRMAKSARLETGDQVLVRWRDKNGTFDAREITIVGIFDSNVPSIDAGQVWIPLERLQEMTGMTGEATLLVAREGFQDTPCAPWVFKDLGELLKDFDQVMQAKKGSSRIVYGLLLAIALLAVFDTQVLSVFRRQKEIGTYIALGMTRFQVMRLFTVEGSTYSILALLLGALYGIPLLLFLHRHGIPMPKSADEMGLSITDSIIPVYSIGMVLSTVLLVVISATIVSFFPARRITRMKPTDALRGKAR